MQQQYGGPPGAPEYHQQQQLAPQREPMRPRSKSAFSITSNQSKTSRRSADKEPLRESHDEKRKLAFSNTAKSNPNAAMNEMQPIAQQLEKATIASLRSSQYFDMHGSPITDPDFSNPTRRRTERPLETIMSFEAAIDREYKRQRDAAREAARMSFAQNDNNGPDNSGYESKRSSYWGGGEYAGNGYYLGPSRSRGSYMEGPPSRNKFGARMNSEPIMQRYNGGGHPYSTPGYGQTRDTINTGGSNGSASDQWHNSTDPSSDNSSIERMKAEGHGEYGYPTPPQREPISEDGHYTYNNGGGYNPSYMAGAGPGASSGHPAHQYNNGPPAPPPKAVMGGPVQAPPVHNPAAPRQLIKLNPAANDPSRPPAGEKRKSWLKRRFSKN